MKERIQKVLASAGIASRRAVEEMVLQGRIEVNGKVVNELPVMIDPQKDKVKIDGEGIRLKEIQSGVRYYILMNKPAGVISTNVAQGEQTRVIDLLPRDFPARVYPVGRLDSETKGLILLTNDGELTNRLTHPRFGVNKVYRATVDGNVPESAARELEKGVWLADKRGKAFKTGACKIHIARRIGQKSILEISLREGRNVQIRRMLAKLGHKVREVVRVKYGPIELKSLAPGQIRPLTPREVNELRKSSAPRNDGENSKYPNPKS